MHNKQDLIAYIKDRIEYFESELQKKENTEERNVVIRVQIVELKQRLSTLYSSPTHL